MREKTILKVGDKVHYIPFKGVSKSQYENGIVKSVCSDEARVFVVYHCAGEWDNYQDYTGVSTRKEDLRMGWVEKPKNQIQ